MIRILGALAMLALAASSFLTVTPTLAVDPTISAHCRPGAPAVYSRPGGFCDAVANNHSLASEPGKPLSCAVGEVADNNVGHCVLLPT
jgi:hypothetical protein